MNVQPQFFAPLARLLHWSMALMVIAMLFIGAGMAASVSERHEWLIHLHKPLGIAILALVIVRLVVRFSTRQPPLPADLPLCQPLAAAVWRAVTAGDAEHHGRDQPNHHDGAVDGGDCLDDWCAGSG